MVGASEKKREIRSVALIGNQARSMLNFRGPFIRAMVDCGVRVYALAPDYDQHSREAVFRLGAAPVDISLDRTGLNPVRDVIDVLRLRRVLRHVSPDATFAYFIKPVIYGSLAAKFAGVPYRFSLVAGLGYSLDPDHSCKNIKRFIMRNISLILYRLAFSCCKTVFFQNEEDKAFFIKYKCLSPHKAIRINGTGVDLEHFNLAPPVANPVTFIMMARLIREKGVYDYVEAARIIKHKYPGVRFLLLGATDRNPNSLTKEEIESWVRDGILDWPGEVSDVRPWIARSSVFVLPSYYREGVPRSAQEAMAMGRPIVTTNTVGCRETVVNGVNGFLIPVRAPYALAEAMERFINDKKLIEKMGINSRKIAEKKFDVNKINRNILRHMRIL